MTQIFNVILSEATLFIEDCPHLNAIMLHLNEPFFNLDLL